MNHVIRANHMISLITSSTMDPTLPKTDRVTNTLPYDRNRVISLTAE